MEKWRKRKDRKLQIDRRFHVQGKKIKNNAKSEEERKREGNAKEAK